MRVILECKEYITYTMTNRLFNLTENDINYPVAHSTNEQWEMGIQVFADGARVVAGKVNSQIYSVNYPVGAQGTIALLVYGLVRGILENSDLSQPVGMIEAEFPSPIGINQPIQETEVFYKLVEAGAECTEDSECDRNQIFKDRIEQDFKNETWKSLVHELCEQNVEVG